MEAPPPSSSGFQKPRTPTPVQADTLACAAWASVVPVVVGASAADDGKKGAARNRNAQRLARGSAFSAHYCRWLATAERDAASRHFLSTHLDRDRAESRYRLIRIANARLAKATDLRTAIAEMMAPYEEETDDPRFVEFDDDLARFARSAEPDRVTPRSGRPATWFHHLTNGFVKAKGVRSAPASGSRCPPIRHKIRFRSKALLDLRGVLLELARLHRARPQDEALRRWHNQDKIGTRLADGVDFIPSNLAEAWGTVVVERWRACCRQTRRTRSSR